MKQIATKNIKYLFYFRSATWLILAVIYFIRQASPNPNVTYSTVAILLLINALIYFSLGFLLEKKSKLVFWITSLFVFANIILTITDNFGIIDGASLLIDITIITLLVSNKKALC